ncbi:hypothetical protein ACFXPZ_25280 [Streptomyces sp. NPDC059101]|uniref:hypothetical protein n=1 Tax=unclassified Streptomyces TaxID=2593676 RepID=UPI003693ECE7
MPGPDLVEDVGDLVGHGADGFDIGPADVHCSPGRRRLQPALHVFEPRDGQRRGVPAGLQHATARGIHLCSTQVDHSRHDVAFCGRFCHGRPADFRARYGSSEHPGERLGDGGPRLGLQDQGVEVRYSWAPLAAGGEVK